MEVVTMEMLAIGLILLVLVAGLIIHGPWS